MSRWVMDAKTKATVENKANTVHQHQITDVENLNESLSTKAAAVHIHNTDNIVGLDDYVDDKIELAVSTITGGGSGNSYLPSGWL